MSKKKQSNFFPLQRKERGEKVTLKIPPSAQAQADSLTAKRSKFFRKTIFENQQAIFLRMPESCNPTGCGSVPYHMKSYRAAHFLLKLKMEN